MRVDQLRFSLHSDEIVVQTRTTDLRSMKSHVRPEHGTGHLDQGRGGSEPLQNIAQSHSEVCQDSILRSRGVRLAEKLQRHLTIGLDHGFHGRLLGGIRH